MKSLDSVKGIVVPMVTPLSSDETLDVKAVENLYEHLALGGVHGIFLLSTTGEGLCLTDKVKSDFCDHMTKINHKDIPLYVGISDTSTKRTIQNAHAVADKGFDIAVAHAPYYFPANNQDELISFFESVAISSPLPVMIYNIPSTTQSALTLDSVRKLMQVENIIGIKDSSVDFVFLQYLIDLKRDRPDFKILIGKSHFWAAGILAGADGGLDGISNVIPGKCVQLYNACINKEQNIFELQKTINHIWKIYDGHSFLGGLKYTLYCQGLIQPHLSAPISPANEVERQNIENIIDSHGLCTLT
jgi:4-hydroxy-tetrahydrodipicolinate synthase